MLLLFHNQKLTVPLASWLARLYRLYFNWIIVEIVLQIESIKICGVNVVDTALITTKKDVFCLLRNFANIDDVQLKSLYIE